MKSKLWLCTIVSLLCTVTSFAQDNKPYWALHLNAGTSISNTYVGSEHNADIGVKVGYQFGISADYVLPSNLYFQSGLVFASKGAKYDQHDSKIPLLDYYTETPMTSFIDEQSVSVNPIYLQVPINVGYKFELNNDLSVNIAGGPYLSYGVGGKATLEEVNNEGHTEKNKQNVFGKDGWKRFDAGFNVQLGAEYNKFSVNFGYNFGMVNVDRMYDIYNRNLFISFGYRVF